MPLPCSPPNLTRQPSAAGGESVALKPWSAAARQVALGLALLASGNNTVRAAGPAADVSYVQDIRPLLEAHCVKCHSGEDAKNDLRLDTVTGLLKGGESGDPVFIPKDPVSSQIISRVISSDPHLQMPPKGERLPAAAVDLLKRWISTGAMLPGEAAARAALEAQEEKITTDHWSFQPVKRPPEPVIDDPWIGGSIDGFILKSLREKSLTPSAAADRRTLIRRLFLLMHGMPPTPEEVESFVTDPHPDAWSKRVDQVLASPHYGERWARHWLDVVRYADSNGYETNRERKTAWPYRDYVIDAFNKDKPYDQFIREQLAGDALGEDAATGFLVAGPYDIVKSPDINLSLMQREDELADMVNTTGTAFMGLTMGCARCHNHKFDPILQKDYYSMQAVFAGVTHGERPLRKTPDASAKAELAGLEATVSGLERELSIHRQHAEQARQAAAGGKLRPAVNALLNVEEFAPVETTSLRFTILATNSAAPCLDELEIFDDSGKNIALAGAGAIVTTSGSLGGNAFHRLEHVNDGQPGNGRSWIADTPGQGWVQVDLPAKSKMQRIVWSRDREGKYKDRLATDYRIETATAPGRWTLLASSRDRVKFDPDSTADSDGWLGNLTEEEATTARRVQTGLAAARQRITQLSGGTPAWLGVFSQPGKTHRLYRGDPLQKREVVAPGGLTVLGSLGLSKDEPEQRRRLRLAEWIAQPGHPLTARVMVNRLWHYIFGHGLADTPSDLGVNGARPSHPELLDWLADEFVRSGWSVKHLQRLILLSATFQQSSLPRTEAQTVDSEARLLWRFPPRRLEAEAIRDSMLAVSGALNPAAGGPGFYLMEVEEENVMHYHVKEKFTAAEFRRMVYQTRIRQTTDGVFGSFDCPDGSQVMPRRSRSNTALQALNLFNSPFVLQQAGLLADRLLAEAGTAPEQQVETAFPLFYGRPPDDFERRQSAALIQAEGLPAFCRALYNTSEFLFVF